MQRPEPNINHELALQSHINSVNLLGNIPPHRLANQERSGLLVALEMALSLKSDLDILILNDID